MTAVSGHRLAAETAPKVRRVADGAPDDRDVERENDDERRGRVRGELDVVERHVHEPVARQRHAPRRTAVALDKVDRL